MPEADKCIIDNFGGFGHPYSYCVKPPNEMVPSNGFRKSYNLDQTGQVLGGIFSYIEYLTIDGNIGTARECKDSNGVGLIGNRYVLKTNVKCTEINSRGEKTGNEPTLHKYVNNVSDGSSFLTGGRPLPDATGVIPATFASATKIGDNVFGLLTSFSGKTKPYCMEASLKCHIIDNQGNKGYRGFSPNVHFSIDDIKNLPREFFNGENKPNIPNTANIEEDFKNINNETNDIAKNIIEQNIDKLQNFSDFDNLLNSINFQDDFLVKTYYLALSAIMIIIIFKILYKK